MGWPATLVALAMLTPPPIPSPRDPPPAGPRVTAMAEIKLHDGVNAIAAFTEDGRDGLIVKGFRSYFTADGSHDDVFVLTRRRAERGHDLDPRWSVVTAGTDTTSGPDDPELLTDAPRAFETTVPSPSHVEITLYRLRHDQQADGDVFVRLETRRPSACYGNTDLALNQTLGLPLPDGYEGPRTSGICGAE